ncbi:MAG: tetratricopeptide repeat protein [Spirochaetales bacterium]|nr:tetratricopeptide repeat protein [Spirochaetales bacterium]
MMMSIKDAETYMQSGKYAEAKEILEQILAHSPDDAEAICNIGIAYTETGENIKAIRALEYYTGRIQDNPRAWEALGCAYFRRKDYAAAYRHLREAQKLAPQNPSVIRNLGVLFGVKGERELGYDMLKKALDMSPYDFRTLYALSYVHREFDNRKEARQTMELLLDLDIPEEIRKDTLLNMIKLDIGWD